MSDPVRLERLLRVLNIDIRFQIVELLPLVGDGGICEVITSRSEVVGLKADSSVLWFHRINETGFLIIAQIVERGDIHGNHHFVVFVDEVAI